MVIISLILGVVLGAISVMFVLQNVAVVTVSFLTYQVTASLAIVLLATLMSGILITLLILLPSLIKDEIKFSHTKRRVKELEEELQKTRSTHAVIQPGTTHSATPAQQQSNL